jgi:hypothetical protein
MTTLFPGCGPSCYRKKKLDALQYANDSEEKEIAIYGHGYVQSKKEKEATVEADKQVLDYKKRFSDFTKNSQKDDPQDVKDMKYQIERDSTLAAILNNLNGFFSKPPPSSHSGWWFGIFLDFIITILSLAVIYLIYSTFSASRIVGGKRLGK